MIRRLFNKLFFKVTPPIEFGFEFHPVRIESDLPNFKAVMLVDKFGKCSSSGSILRLKDANLENWYLGKSNNGTPFLCFQIAGRIFDVDEDDVTRVFSYFMETLPQLWKRD